MLRSAVRKEDQIVDQLAGLERRIAEGIRPRDRGSRSVVSFLKQLHRDREETLQRLRREIQVRPWR
jgi:hypothetical protein